ncbi:cytochrome c [Weizmannia acidilactici]|uniref:Cytochrome c n=1 Tax=Weizmannia acidilactici TaxID=2607726 RepID=A0A5J4JGF3_9BACI|nr:cytochrome c [Weizmannia acidilactici]GER66924.1 cytochrome c [Weizmannia acidilactici]GER69577.1 cytochrome c [Weizmannia acidilactici]
MKKNPVIPYLLIMVFGLALVFFFSIKGVGDAKQVAKEKESPKQTQTADSGKFDPESFAKKTCATCHGNNLQGAVGPNLHGVGKKLSKDKIKDVLKNGTSGGMPAGLVEADHIDEMADWVSKLK